MQYMNNLVASLRRCITVRSSLIAVVVLVPSVEFQQASAAPPMPLVSAPVVSMVVAAERVEEMISHPNVLAATQLSSKRARWWESDASTTLSSVNGRDRMPNSGGTSCSEENLAPDEPDMKPSALALQLGLGLRKTASRLLLRAPRKSWVEAVTGKKSRKLLWPIENGGRFVRGFGWVRSFSTGRRRLHKGMDVSAPEGTPIFAVSDGLVAYSDNEVRGYGNLIMIVHDDASVAFYAHCRTLHVVAGQQVSAGQFIAEVGETGRATGPHIHFELRIAGRARDPLPWFVAVISQPRSDGESGGKRPQKVLPRTPPLLDACCS